MSLFDILGSIPNVWAHTIKCWGVRAGPAMKGFQRRIGHAPINLQNLDLFFGHGEVHALIDALRLGPLVCFFPERYDRSNNPKNIKSDQKLILKKKRRADTQSLWTCGWDKLSIWDKNSQNWAWHRSNATRYWYSLSLLLVWCVGTVFFGRVWWWVINWGVQVLSIVSLCFHFHLGGERRFWSCHPDS